MLIYFYAESQFSKILYDPESLGNLGIWAEEKAELDFPSSPVVKTLSFQCLHLRPGEFSP